MPYDSPTLGLCRSHRSTDSALSIHVFPALQLVRALVYWSLRCSVCLVSSYLHSVVVGRPATRGRSLGTLAGRLSWLCSATCAQGNAQHFRLKSVGVKHIRPMQPGIGDDVCVWHIRRYNTLDQKYKHQNVELTEEYKRLTRRTCIAPIPSCPPPPQAPRPTSSLPTRALCRDFLRSRERRRPSHWRRSDAT